MSKVNEKFISFLNKKRKKYQAGEDDGINTLLKNKPHSRPVAHGENKFKNIFSEDVDANQNNQNDGTLKSLLGQMAGRMIVKEDKEQSNSDVDDSDESEESDYEVEKINHLVGNNTNFDQDDIQSSIEEINKKAERRKKILKQVAEKKKNEPPQNRNGKFQRFQKNEKFKGKHKFISYNNQNTLYLGNLPEDADQNTLMKKLKTFGDIKSIRMKTNKEGKSKGFCYVDLANQETLNKILLGKHLKVGGKELKIEKAHSTFNEKVKPTQRVGKKKQKILNNKKFQ